MIRYGGVKFLVAGLVVVLLSAAILWANRTERTEEVAGELVEAAGPVPENDGRLVLVTGTPRLADGGVLVDEEAGLEVEGALSYSRVPYQLVYVEKSRKVVVDKGEDKRDPSDDVTRTEHYLAKDWIIANHEREDHVSDLSGSHENPPATNLSAYHAVSEVYVAGFHVDSSALYDHLQTRNGTFTKEELEQACGDYITRSELPLEATTDEDGSGMLSTGDEVGDVHVLFGYTTLEGAEPVTVVGRQRADELVLEDEGWLSSAEQVRSGAVSKEEFLQAISAEDASSRTIGVGGLVLGAVLVLLSLDWSGVLGAGRRKGR